MLKEKMRYKDEELGRLVNLRDGTTRLEVVKKEIGALRNRAIEAKSQLALKIAELERMTVDNKRWKKTRGPMPAMMILAKLKRRENNPAAKIL